MGFQPGNRAALVHGGYSTKNDQNERRAANHRRRLLRQNGLRKSDLNALGQALLANWARAAAALAAMDEYAGREGWLDGDGNPRPFTKLYVLTLNSERHALRALEGHLRDRPDADPLLALEAAGRKARDRWADEEAS